MDAALCAGAEHQQVLVTQRRMSLCLDILQAPCTCRFRIGCLLRLHAATQSMSSLFAVAIKSLAWKESKYANRTTCAHAVELTSLRHVNGSSVKTSVRSFDDGPATKATSLLCFTAGCFEQSSWRLALQSVCLGLS